MLKLMVFVILHVLRILMLHLIGFVLVFQVFKEIREEHVLRVPYPQLFVGKIKFWDLIIFVYVKQVIQEHH